MNIVIYASNDESIKSWAHIINGEKQKKKNEHKYGFPCFWVIEKELAQGKSK